MKGTIYKLVSTLDNAPLYIGSTLGSLNLRFQQHKSALKSSLRDLYTHIRENGVSIEIVVVEEVEVSSIRELRKIEKYWIEKYRQEGAFLKNSISPITNENPLMTNVRIEHDVLERVRSYVEGTENSIGGFISMVIKEKMDKLDQRKIKSKKYASANQ